MGRRLDRRVVVLEPVTKKSGTGNIIHEGWAEQPPVPASFEPLSDAERWQAGAVEQKADARFILRASKRAAKITGRNGLRYDGDDWHITGVKPLGRAWIEITAWRRITGDLSDVG